MTKFLGEHAFLRAPAAPKFLTPEFFNAGPFSGGALLAHGLEFVEQQFAGEETVESLLAGLLTFDLNSTGTVQEHHAGSNLVDVLTAVTTGTDEGLFDVRFTDAEGGHALSKLRFFVG